VWCLYELLLSLRSGVSLELTLAPEEQQRLITALQADHRKVLGSLTSFDVRDADVSVAADKSVILQMIASSFDGEGEASIDYFNHETRSALRDALAAFSWAV
jgi:hypothetical protein